MEKDFRHEAAIKDLSTCTCKSVFFYSIDPKQFIGFFPCLNFVPLIRGRQFYKKYDALCEKLW